MFFNDIKLDYTSDYMFDESKWPKPSCDVMVTSDVMTSLMHRALAKDPECGYVDIYALIDPERRVVTEFEVIFQDEDDSQESIIVKVSDTADGVEYYHMFENQGGDEFKKFIADANIKIHSLRMAQVNLFEEVVENFLEDRNIRIPSSDESMKENGVDITDNDARIYGVDYDEITCEFENHLSYGLENTIQDRIRALAEWQKKYLPDEMAFYEELHEAGFTERQIEDACGIHCAEATKKFWEEHGMI